MATQATLAALRRRNHGGAGGGLRGAAGSRASLDVVRPNWYPFDEGYAVAAKLGGARRDRQADVADLERIVVRIQAFFRGFRARKYATKVFHRKVLISKAAFLKVANEVKRLHLGWNHLCVHVLLFFLVICLAYFQFIAFLPSTHSQEYALVRALESVATEDGVAFADVASLLEAKAFVRAMSQSFAHTDPYFIRDKVSAAECDFQSCAGDLSQIIDKCSNVTQFSGFLDQYNRHQIGLVVAQRRFKMGACHAHFEDLYEGLSVYDPVYPEKRCARAGSKADEYESFLTEAYPEILRNFSLFGLNPFEKNADLGTFLTIVDLGLLNIDQAYMDCVFDYLFDQVEWVDHATSELCATVVVQNLNGRGRYGYMKACFYSDVGGLITPKVTVHSAQGSTKGVRPGAIFLATVYAVLIFVSMCLLAAKWTRKLQCQVGAWKARSGRALSWIVLCFETGIILLHVLVLVRFFQFECSSDALEPFDGTDAENVLHGVLEIVNFVQGVTFTKRIYAVLLILMVIRTIQHLDFHPDTGIISRTLKRATSDIFSFVFVYMLVVLAYAFVGFLMYSPYGEAFSTYFESVTTLLFVSMGEFDATMTVIFSDVINSDKVIAQIFFWTYVFFTTLVLFNILLSIIVESFVTFQEASDASPTISFWQSLELSSAISLYDVRNYHWPKFLAVTQAICARCGCGRASDTAGAAASAAGPKPGNTRSLDLREPSDPLRARVEMVAQVSPRSSSATVPVEQTPNGEGAPNNGAGLMPVQENQNWRGASGASDKGDDSSNALPVAALNISHTDLEALDGQPTPAVPAVSPRVKNISMLFSGGVTLEQLAERPHRYVDRLAFLRVHVAGSVPTFALRQELRQAFSEAMTERLLWLFRERTEELRPSEAREEVNMLFPESASQLYIIDQLKKVTNRLNEIAEKQRRAAKSQQHQQQYQQEHVTSAGSE